MRWQARVQIVIVAVILRLSHLSINRHHKTHLTLIMAPTPINFNALQPFKAIRDNWYTVQPYYDNYTNTISLATVLLGFLGSISLIIKHGFTFPRLHPMMVDVDDLEPTSKHINEFVKEKDLADSRLWEMEERMKEMVMDEKIRGAGDARDAPQHGNQVGESDTEETEEEGIEPMTTSTEQPFHETAEMGLDQVSHKVGDKEALDDGKEDDGEDESQR